MIGLGATDMKGGLAVMLELAAWMDEARPSNELDLGLLFFTREELPVAESPLPRVFEACPELREADLAVVLEPTDNTIQAGCLGNLTATLTFLGKSAHSARPWLGVNAINRAVEGLEPITRVTPVPVDIDGLVFTEVLSVTRIEGGIADNVIPDRVSCRLNFRFAPNRTVDEAADRLAGPRRRCRHARDHEQLAARPCRGPVAARPTPPGGRRVRGRAEAGLDARRPIQRGGH